MAFVLCALAFACPGWSATALQPEITPQIGHALSVDAVALSADGALAATGSRDGSAALWDAKTGRKLRSFSADPLGVSAVALSPDGRLLAAAGAGVALVWDARTARLRQRLGVPGEFLTALLFTPDGRGLISAGSDGAARLWDLKTGEFRSYQTGARRLTGAALSRDGKRLAVVAGGQTAWVFETASGRPTGEVREGGPWTSVALYADGRLLVTGSEERARVWDLAQGREAYALKAAAISAVAISPDGKRLYTCGGTNTARAWNLASGEAAAAFIGHIETVRALALSRDGRRLITGGDDRAARVWDTTSARELKVLAGPPLSPLFAAFAAGGRRLVTVDAASARLWDVESGRVLSVSTGDWSAASRFSLSADGRRLAWIDERKTLERRELDTGLEPVPFADAPLKAHAAAFDADGGRLAAAYDGDVTVWDAEAGQRVARLGERLDARWLRFGPDGARLAVGEPGGALSVWNLVTGRRLARYEGDSEPDLAATPDGRFLAAGEVLLRQKGRYRLAVYALSDGALLKAWETRGRRPPLAFGRDGTSLWVADQDTLWELDIATGRKLASVRLPAGATLPWPEAILARRRLALALKDGTLTALSLKSGRERGRLSLSEAGWLATAPDLRLDGSAGAARCTIGFESLPLDRCAGRRLSPGLLAEILAAEP